METFMQKCGLLCCNNVVYIEDFHPRSQDASSCIPYEFVPMSYLLLLFVHLFLDGMLQISLTLCPCSPIMQSNARRNHRFLFEMMLWYPKVHLDLAKEHVYFFFPIDGLFIRHQNTHLVEPTNYHKQVVMSLLVYQHYGKSTTLHIYI